MAVIAISSPSPMNRKNKSHAHHHQYQYHPKDETTMTTTSPPNRQQQQQNPKQQQHSQKSKNNYSNNTPKFQSPTTPWKTPTTSTPTAATPSSMKRSRTPPSQQRKPRSDSEGSFSDSSATSDSTSSCDSSPASQQRRGRRNGRKLQTRPPSTCPILSLEEQQQYVAMDCEMVGVGEEGRDSQLARVTLIDWNGETLLDEYVRPSDTIVITDYRTFVSGITHDDLYGPKAVELETIRSRVCELIEHKIVIGHALKNDFTALQIRNHPWYLIRDTAKYEPFMKVRFVEDGVLWPRKLKELVAEKCHRDIQVSGQPHCSFEDALAALDLYKLARDKWEKVMAYKINKTKAIEQQKSNHDSSTTAAVRAVAMSVPAQ